MATLTGEAKVFWMPSRTKDHAVHAGPSQLLAPWSPYLPLKKASSPICPNNNWLIAQPAMATMDAMVVWWPSLTPTSRITVLKAKMNTPTKQETENVSLKITIPESVDSLKSQIVEPWKLQFLTNPSPSLLMLATGHSMVVVSWTNATRAWTTVSL